MSFKLHYVIGGAVTYPPGARLHERVMNDYEVVWIQRGEVVYHAEGKDHPAPAGSVVLSRPGRREGYTWDPKEATRHSFFHFDFADPPGEWGTAEGWPLVRAMPEGDIVRPLMDYVVGNVGQLSRGDAPPATVGRAIETLLSAFIIGPLTGVSAFKPTLPEPVHRAIEFIGRRLTEDPAALLTLDGVADAAMVSAKHLCRLFSHAVHMSPMDVVMLYRLHHAAHLLARTDLKMEVIARHCGFATSFHFSRRFKEFYGKPPREFRQEALAGRTTVPTQLRLPAGIAIEY